MAESWDKMKRAKEDEHFDRENKEALARFANKKPRLSPITGQPMEQIEMMGIVIDKCPTSGGIWLDAGELETLLDIAKNEDKKGNTHALEGFFKFITGKE